MSQLTEDDIQALLHRYLKEELDEDELLRARGRGERTRELNAVGFDVELDFLEQALTEEDYSRYTPHVDSFLSECGVEFDPESDAYKRLCLGVCKERVRIVWVQQHRDDGNFEYERGLLPSAFLAGVAATPKIDQGKPLEDVIAAYLKDREKYKKWKPGSQGDFLYILDVFKQIVGNVPIKSIRAEQAQRYKDVLEQLPTGMSKTKKYQGKTIAEVLKMKSDKTLAPATIQKHLNTVSALFKWAERWGYVDRSYMGSMSVPVTGTAQDERKTWTTEDLTRIFSPDTYPMDGLPYRFWLPTIALYSGMRLEEISQLHLEDIRQEDGVWVFDVNKEGNKTLKTASSKRLVPIHPFLVEGLGLPRYADNLKAEGAKRLFPELKKTDRYKFGKNATAWFSNYKKRIIRIEDKDKSFHSFRHTFDDNLKQQLVDPYMLDELLGHKVSKLSMGLYGNRFVPKLLLEQAICKLDYGVDLSHLAQSPYASASELCLLRTECD